ncbi:unnamed protein product [Urochloa humidicola]
MRNLLGVPNMLTAYLLLAKVSSLILRAAAGALASDCGAENTLKTGDVIQCRECSYHILYKKRTCRREVIQKGSNLAIAEHLKAEIIPNVKLQKALVG